MKFTQYIISIFTFCFSLYLPAQVNQKQFLAEQIKSVEQKFAPDKRVCIFDVFVDSTENEYIIRGETNLIEARKELQQRLDEKDIDYDIKILPDTALGEKKYAIVNVSVANMRTEPGFWQSMATQALLGTVLRVYEKKGGWYLVQTPDDYIAWVFSPQIWRVTKAEANNWLKSSKIIVTSHYGFSYEKADENSQHISDICSGDLLLYKGEKNGFYEVEYPDGERTAYVKKDAAAPFDEWLASRKPTGENIIKTAKTLMGLPYLWGGTSAKGLDCSGFTKLVYFLNGILLPRDASQQVLTGTAIDTENGWENCQAGDLLFFGHVDEETGEEHVGHVAIYIGNNEFIHSGGILQINSFEKDSDNFSEFSYKSYIKARRIINSIHKNEIQLINNNKFYKGI